MMNTKLKDGLEFTAFLIFAFALFGGWAVVWWLMKWVFLVGLMVGFLALALLFTWLMVEEITKEKHQRD